MSMFTLTFNRTFVICPVYRPNTLTHTYKSLNPLKILSPQRNREREREEAEKNVTFNKRRFSNSNYTKKKNKEGASDDMVEEV